MNPDPLGSPLSPPLSGAVNSSYSFQSGRWRGMKSSRGTALGTLRADRGRRRERAHFTQKPVLFGSAGRRGPKKLLTHTISLIDVL